MDLLWPYDGLVQAIVRSMRLKTTWKNWSVFVCHFTGLQCICLLQWCLELPCIFSQYIGTCVLNEFAFLTYLGNCQCYSVHLSAMNTAVVLIPLISLVWSFGSFPKNTCPRPPIFNQVCRPLKPSKPQNIWIHNISQFTHNIKFIPRSEVIATDPLGPWFLLCLISAIFCRLFLHLLLLLFIQTISHRWKRTLQTNRGKKLYIHASKDFDG